ncbi:hypothetical protein CHINAEXTREME_05585 [Halobiforma lacisalsi AJ5]|uniref:Uncharacterized protein n=1 Tax=Natronobacterium lacisalsi AJ5 TaxID=358396 RepID=M0LJS7_NATLA|nr:hypothetical protein [Halobiforma lacisalsi]APW97275.1 hypothetical protein CHINAEXTREME_05585 [Halobiforma lacisalsi AJ5]EMA33786.1 hypothetical protein C445_08859 [Halobiforma lacisalsi AJ5]
MRPLRNCDFCDADAAGTFEVLPRDLEPTPTEDEQRRVVLCAECKDRLEVLLEPLLARAAGGVDGSATATATATSGGTDAKTERARTNRDSSGTDDPAGSESTGSRSSSGSDSPPELEAARPVETETTHTETRSADDGTTDSSEDATPDTSADSSSKEEITFGDDGIPERSATGTDAETGVEADAGGKARTRESAGTGSESGSSSGSEPGSGAGSREAKASGGNEEESTPTRPSKAYAKVVRLLRNRDFPVKRSEAEALAAGAYDLESDDVEAIVDHAVEQGEFEEHRGKLRRP